MKYVVADIHGEYDLFCALLNRISFSDADEMYICGDIIDKGPQSVKLAKFVFSHPNMYCIAGNHEHAFLKLYHALMAQSPEDFDAVLRKLQEYFPDDEPLDWDTVDRLDGLPYYIETNDFICVHAGVPIEKDGRLAELSKVEKEKLIYDRSFKNADAKHISPKCVFFGHTQTDYVCGKPVILAYRKRNKPAPYALEDFYKIHLDTGAWSNGVLGCFCIDSCQVYYVNK